MLTNAKIRATARDRAQAHADSARYWAKRLLEANAQVEFQFALSALAKNSEEYDTWVAMLQVTPKD